MITPEIDRASHINRISMEIATQKVQRQRLINQIEQMSNNPALLELCFQEKVTLAVGGEMIAANIALLNKAIRKLERETINFDDESCKTNTGPSSSNEPPKEFPMNLPDWFKVKLNQRLAKLKEGARETADTYVKERNASTTVRDDFLHASIQKLEEQHERFVGLFDQTEKTEEGMRILLDELERQSSSLEEEKDRISNEIVQSAEPVAECRAETAELSRAITRLSNLRTEYHQFQLKPEEKLNIFEASQFGQIGVIRKAIEDGTIADINQTDERGYRMLDIAAYANQFVIVDFLLNNGADPTLSDKENNLTPIHWAANRGATDIIERIHRATIQNSKNSVEQTKKTRRCLDALGGLAPYSPKTTLFSRKPKVITQSINRTPLHTAAYHNRLRAIRKLLELGANPNLQTNECDNKKTPLIESILLAGSFLDKIESIRAAGCDHEIDAKETQKDLDRCFETIKIFLKHPGINLELYTIDRVTEERKTAFHHAIDIGVDTCATGILDSLLNYPRIGESIYIKNQKFFESLLDYIFKVQTRKGAPHRQNVVRTLRIYEILTKAEKMRQESHRQIEEQRTRIYNQIVRNNPHLSPQDQIRLVDEQLSKRKQQVDQKVNEFEEMEMRKLEGLLKEQFPPSSDSLRSSLSSQQSPHAVASSSSDPSSLGM